MRTDLLGGAGIALNQLRYATHVASQNINNADNPYYSRSIVVFGNDASGFLTANAERMNNIFLTSQVHSSTSNTLYSDRYLSFASSVDKIITGITPTEDGNSVNPILGGIDDITEAMNALATSDSTSGRSSLLSRINSLIANSNTMQESLGEFKKQVNDEVASNALVLNKQAEQLAELNKKLISSPDDPSLLTQRDTILGKMSELVAIDVTEKSNGTVSVTINGGYSIVDGLKHSEITAETGEYGDDLYLAVNGNVMTNPEKVGGTLGGNLAAREELVNSAERGLSKTLLGFFASINEVNLSGFKKDGSAGTELVSIPSVNALASSNNTGTGNFDVSLDQSKVSELREGPIAIEKTASGYIVTDTSTGDSITTTTAPIEAFGYKFESVGTMVAGDKFVADPLGQMLMGAEVVGSVDDIAAAGKLPVASGDNSNLQKFGELSDQKIFNDGKDTIYNQISNVFVGIGNKHVAAEQDFTTNLAINDTAVMRWNNLSGVNTQEEELNMMKFQQIYQSVSKVIEADSKMFESILGVI